MYPFSVTDLPGYVQSGERSKDTGKQWNQDAACRYSGWTFQSEHAVGTDTVRQLRAKTDLFFDCHVMVTEQDFFVDELLDIGVDQIVFHGETQLHIDGIINRIHAKGVKTGVALKPSTPLTEVEYVLEKCDTVLLMLINPGYAFVKGEKQVTYADRKIRELRKMINDRGLDTKIEVDGRISPLLI